ncbi:MAG TPA: hypothetical protein VHT03_10265 [Rhizomicrobium sp.]|nr:hypothetical protein [Rhizomicrobium sp.]
MIASRSGLLIAAQRAISSSVRPQPAQSPVAGSMAHMLMQGEMIVLGKLIWRLLVVLREGTASIERASARREVFFIA